MKIINGFYSAAVVFTTDNSQNSIDDYAVAQIKMICDNEAAKNSKIRLMPDVHPGKIGPIGLTMTVGEQVLPGLVGIDIGCGMTLAVLKQKKIEYQKLDSIIRERIPSGSCIRRKPHRFIENIHLEELHCYRHIRFDKTEHSLGTLGGGNHFIEVDRDEEGTLYVVFHSGSRHLGKEVADYYMKEGQRVLRENGVEIPYEQTYLKGKLLREYLHDLKIVQKYAALNREAMLDELGSGMKWKVQEQFSCIHNYIGELNETPIVRKGAISAALGERVVIPINMKDGIILGTGLGNTDWNCSAPHGAGRILKRESVASQYTVSAFKAEMKGIYSSCISRETLDEAPFCYRRLPEIQEAISETVSIEKILRPVYNFKAGSRT